MTTFPSRLISIPRESGGTLLGVLETALDGCPNCSGQRADFYFWVFFFFIHSGLVWTLDFLDVMQLPPGSACTISASSATSK